MFIDMGERSFLSTRAAELAEKPLYAQGKYDEAQQFAELGRETGASDDIETQVRWRGALAKVLGRRGDGDRAAVLVREAVVLVEPVDDAELKGDVLMDAAEVFHLQGSRDEAQGLPVVLAACSRRKALRPRPRSRERCWTGSAPSDVSRKEADVPTRRLPSNPNVEHLRNEAKALRRRVAEGDPVAVALAHEFDPGAEPSPEFALARAQLVVARSYGFPSWPKLRHYLDTLAEFARPRALDGTQDDPVDRFLRLACLTYEGDITERISTARELLAAHPELAGANVYTIATVGDLQAARELLARDPGAARRRGGPYAWEPLLYACYSRIDSPRPEHSTLEVARLLLRHGADANAGFVGDWGPPAFTALTGAFGYGEDAPNQPPHQYELELATLLLESGADPNDEQTLYNNHWRRTNEHLELLFRYGLGTGDGGPWRWRLAPLQATPQQMLEDQLLFAAQSGNEARVALLLRHGIDPDGLGTRHPALRGRTAYQLAFESGHADVVELLVEAGAQPPRLDLPDELLAAAMRGDSRRVRELASRDESLAPAAIERDPDRLRHAAELGRPDAVRLLVELGFDVNDKRGAAPLHLAAYNGDRRMVDLLLELGADPMLRDDEHDATPAGWARHAHQDELADYLEELAVPGGRT